MLRAQHVLQRSFDERGGKGCGVMVRGCMRGVVVLRVEMVDGDVGGVEVMEQGGGGGLG